MCKSLKATYIPNRNIIKNFKDFKNLKRHRNLNIFHEASRQTSQKTEKKLKVCPKSMYIPQKVPIIIIIIIIIINPSFFIDKFTIPITNKFGKLKV